MPLISPWTANTDDDTITVRDSCMVCKQPSEVTVPTRGFFAWQTGQPILKALPDLSDDDLETLVSGIHPDCYDQEFGDLL